MYESIHPDLAIFAVHQRIEALRRMAGESRLRRPVQPGRRRRRS